MAPQLATTESLEALQSEDLRKVLDIVDRLRRVGLSGIVSLPQLVVCGDQSSGKSSVLEAITEIPFPRKENLCTRFATEIDLWRSPTSTIQITVTPDKQRSASEQDKLTQFSKTIDDFAQLPEIIDDATQVMGLGRVGEINSRAFSRDVLCVDICGPDRPQTLVDLSGLIHATNKAQSEADKDLILNLVKDYMRNPRTVILAVVSAKNDFANRIVLDHCRALDKIGERTLGIVTKPDYLREGSQNELDWIELVQNRNIYLKLGWHMLRNRADTEMHNTFAQRNEAEATFFSKGRYHDLPSDSVGVDALRNRLSQLLLRHLKKELPSLENETVMKLESTIDEIEKLSEKRTTVGEQRMVLTKISTEIYSTLWSATRGYYDSTLFKTVNRNPPVDGADNIRRFRAVVQYLNLRFAETMRTIGHTYALEISSQDGSETDSQDRVETDSQLDGLENRSQEASQQDISIDEPELVLPIPIKCTRDESISWVQGVLERSRGFELPGTFNPIVISQLFWEQSQNWEYVAEGHIDRTAKACKRFATTVLKHAAPPDFLERLARTVLRRTLLSLVDNTLPRKTSRRHDVLDVSNDQNDSVAHRSQQSLHNSPMQSVFEVPGFSLESCWNMYAKRGGKGVVRPIEVLK